MEIFSEDVIRYDNSKIDFFCCMDNGHITLKATHFRFGSSVVDKGIKRCVEKCIVGRLKILNPDGEEWDIRPLSDKYVGNCKSLIISNFSRKLL